MARTANKTKKSKASPKPVNARVRFLERVACHYYRARFALEEDEALMNEHVGFGMPITPRDSDDGELHALLGSYRWQVGTISFCEDNNGKQYRLLGYGASKQPFKAWGEGVKPLLQNVLMYSEKTMNEKHLKARALIMCPIGPQSPRFMTLLQSQQQFLNLKQIDIDTFAELYQAESTDTVTINTFDDLYIDDKIQVLFREQDLLRRGLI